MAKAPTLCTGTTKLTTITEPYTGTRSPICTSCHSLVISNAINQGITRVCQINGVNPQQI